MRIFTTFKNTQPRVNLIPVGHLPKPNHFEDEADIQYYLDYFNSDCSEIITAKEIREVISNDTSNGRLSFPRLVRIVEEKKKKNLNQKSLKKTNNPSIYSESNNMAINVMLNEDEKIKVVQQTQNAADQIIQQVSKDNKQVSGDDKQVSGDNKLLVKPVQSIFTLQSIQQSQSMQTMPPISPLQQTLMKNKKFIELFIDFHGFNRNCFLLFARRILFDLDAKRGYKIKFLIGQQIHTAGSKRHKGVSLKAILDGLIKTLGFEANVVELENKGVTKLKINSLKLSDKSNQTHYFYGLEARRR